MEKTFSFIIKKLFFTGGFLLLCAAIFLGTTDVANAAILSVSPSSGTFSVGSTFDVSIFLNTEGQSVNAMGVSMSFSPDKLQLVSPSAGKSIIGVWTASPQFNNQTGKIELQGGVPRGINVSNGLITTLTFRVKSVGNATLKFLDDSRVLLNDGLGTDVLKNTNNGVYQLILPPPAGPLVASETHPNQATWYANPNVVLRWDLVEQGEGYSYVLNREPVENPDNISEGDRTSINYKNLADGVHYFHIKALRQGVWGGTTHFAIQIDNSAPADFPVTMIPSNHTDRRQPVVQFNSTDALSGIDHYELKLIPLKIKPGATPGADQQFQQPLFIEAESPYILAPLDFGTYDVIVRAYDKAGNYRDVQEHLSIVSSVFEFVGQDGLYFGNLAFIPWLWVWIVLALLIAPLGYGAIRVRRWHDAVVIKRQKGGLSPEIKKQLEELHRYRSKYGPKALVIAIAVFASLLFNFHGTAKAEQVQITPPLINTISHNISNEEIFYVGGKTDTAQTQVVIYMQNLQTGETTSQEVVSDKNGEWFYRHNAFLSSGNYLLWAQSKMGDLISPPGPQFQMSVRPVALQFGSSRISFETLYLIVGTLLLLLVISLVLYIIFHAYHGRKKHKHFVKEMKEAEESVRRGFAVLRRDIQAELALVKKVTNERPLSGEEKGIEEQLVRDMAQIERYIGKEIWDVRKVEGSQ